jgi:hypothetical protein
MYTNDDHGISKKSSVEVKGKKFLTSAKIAKGKYMTFKSEIECLRDEVFLEKIRIQIQKINNNDMTYKVSEKHVEQGIKFLKKLFATSALTSFGNDEIVFFYPTEAHMLEIEQYLNVYVKMPQLHIFTDRGDVGLGVYEDLLEDRIKDAYQEKFRIQISKVSIFWSKIESLNADKRKIEELISYGKKMQMLGFIEAQEVDPERFSVFEVEKTEYQDFSGYFDQEPSDYKGYCSY